MESLRAAALTLCFALVCGNPVKRSDDANPLEALVQQQAQAMDLLQAKVSAMETKQASLESKLNLMNQQIAFTASYSTTGVNIGASVPLRFDAVTTNQGNAYDSSTGVFTAPIAGTYTFFFVVENDRTPRDHSYIHLGLFAGDRRLCAASANGPPVDNFDEAICQAVTHLQTGEHVFVRRTEGDHVIQGGGFTHFTGFLIAADGN